MKSLREELEAARAHQAAIGHFNVSEWSAVKAIMEAVRETGLTAMIGVSEGEREFMSIRALAVLIKYFREELGLPIYLNADHTHDLKKVEEAAKAGADEILFDGSKLAFEENLKMTKRAVEIAKTFNPAVLVEGELGYIGSSSEIMKELPADASLKPELYTTPKEAEQFVRETKIDVLAPAVGNMHGLTVKMAEGKAWKHLDLKRIKDIHTAAGLFLTLHGGSGTADKDFVGAVKAGITIVHINTEIRYAWRKGVEAGLRSHPEEIAPYKILPKAVEAMKNIIASRLKLFQAGD